MNADTLPIISSEQRRAFAKAQNTMRQRHNEFVAKAQNMPVPPEPCTYMAFSEVGYCIRDVITYAHHIAELYVEVLDGINEMAVDFANVSIKPEPAACIRDVVHDWSAPLEAAADEMIEASSVEARARRR